MMARLTLRQENQFNQISLDQIYLFFVQVCILQKMILLDFKMNLINFISRRFG